MTSFIKVKYVLFRVEDEREIGEENVDEKFVKGVGGGSRDLNNYLLLFDDNKHLLKSCKWGFSGYNARMFWLNLVYDEKDYLMNWHP